MKSGFGSNDAAIRPRGDRVWMKLVLEINDTQPPTFAGIDHDRSTDLAGGRLSRRG
ncbi:MAG: hypothetical protein JO329_26210 [Planctomycetaceae bacterium]|jgi:hypothetical protein|nr:hypothetical protein [Planctomycetaceae bacterium]